ncbi:MAG TPA: hypothetical protein VES62_05525 [Thermoleophilaceae bacterium]|nr:hypothetical protein [Thermoleophilaceae bacterium]
MLDEFLPHYDFNEVHSIACSAPPAAVMKAARELTPRELPLLVALMAIRSVPALARGRRLPVRGTILDAFLRGGFVILKDEPDELVLGAVGRFWQASGGMARIEPKRFSSFAEPGWTKAAFGFRVEGCTVLTTETRVLATDDGARRKFGHYWRLIRPGSCAIRVAWLRAIRRRAQRTDTQGLAGAAGSG